MGVQRQQERGAFLHDAHPCMPVPVDVSLVPFGLPKPTLQIHVVLEAGFPEELEKFLALAFLAARLPERT